MDERNEAGKELLLLILGFGMCIGGLYLFFANLTVRNFTLFSSGVKMFGLFSGDGLPGGMVFIPLVLGIMIWIMLPKMYVGQLITGAGVLIIILSVIESLKVEFKPKNGFEFTLMLVLIFGGLALMLRVLLLPKIFTGSSKMSKKDEVEKYGRR